MPNVMTAFEDARIAYNMMVALKYDLPDGMFDAARDAASFYRESDKSEAAKDQFVQDIHEILDEFGFPSTFS